MKRFRPLCLLFAALILLTAGCAGYQRGSTVPEAYRSIHVAAFENQTLFPMAGATATQQLLDALIEDGTFRPDSYDSSRLRVQAIITSLGSNATRYHTNDRVRPEEYRMTLRCTLYVYDAANGQTLIAGKQLTATDGFITNDDYQTGLQKAIPRASRKLAQEILRELQTL